jgi:hypothetical protein
MWADNSRMSEKAFGKFARLQGIPDWDAAGLVSDMTGVGLEAAHRKLTAIDLEQVLPASSPRALPVTTFQRATGSPSLSIPLGRLAASPGTRAPAATFWSALSERDSESNCALLALVRDSNKTDSARLKALQGLIENGAEDELFAVVNDSDRYESWRLKALEALRDLAAGSSAAMEYLNRLVHNSDRYESWRLKALDTLCRSAGSSSQAMGYLNQLVHNSDRYESWRVKALDTLCVLAQDSLEAAEYLFRLVNNSDRYESWRLKALRALIRGGYREYLRRIAANSDRYDSWRREAREALGE